MIAHPTLGIIPMEPFWYQSKLLLDESKLRLVLKSRQTGLSQTVALDALHDCLYRDRHTVLFVSRDLESAKNLLSYVRTAWEEGCPRPPGVELLTDNKTELAFSNGSRIKSVAATKNAGRGFAASAVYIDEAAFQQWDKEIYRAIKPTISTGGRITILSTPNGRANLFFLLWNGDVGKGYAKHRVHWTDCPLYLLPAEKAAIEAALAGGHYNEEELAKEKHYRDLCQWFADNRDEMTTEHWASEYDCDFRQSGLACFSELDIEAVFKKAMAFEEPVPGATYVTFWDVGKKDAAVGTTLRIIREASGKIRKRIVAWERSTDLPYRVLAKKIDERHKRYGGKTYVESNSIGQPLIEQCETKVIGQFTSDRQKVDMITELQLDLENQILDAPPIAQLRAELLMYQWEDRGLVQDCVMSLSGACLATSTKLVTTAKSRPASGGSRQMVAQYQPMY